MKIITTIIQGIIMGIVETVPGISGSTLALIMGIYDEFLDLLHQLSDLAKALFKVLTFQEKPSYLVMSFVNINFVFGTKLFLGMIIGIAIFSHVLTFFIENYPLYTYSFFFGLILFSINLPYDKIVKKDMRSAAIVIITTIGFFILFGLTPQDNQNPSSLLLFVSGILGISGLILPGVSGSFVLLIIGVYEYVFVIVKKLTNFSASSVELQQISFFIFGLIIGFVGFVRILKFLLKNYNDYLMAILTGIMIASLRILWPFMDVNSSKDIEFMRKISPLDLPLETSVFILIIIFLSGGLIIFLKKFNRKKEQS